jgi:biopolymer transport protein ExbD
MSSGKGRRSVIGDEALNLIPIMNLVSILIPFLLMAAQFVHLAVIDSTLPAIGDPQETPPDEDDEPPLQLSLVLTSRGITVAGADAILKPEGAEGAAEPIEGEEEQPTIPCKDPNCATAESYDYEELTRILGLIKDEYPDDENVILVPESRIPYEVIILTMDASRQDSNSSADDGQPRTLFPFVVIAGGIK